MHAMLLDSETQRLDELQIAFLEAGIHVTGSGSLAVAECCLRRAVVDVLLLDENAAGFHVADVITMAERRNPNLVTLMLSSQVGVATDKWSSRFGSLHCVLGGETDPALLARMAKASLRTRVREQTAEIAHKSAPKTFAAPVAKPAPQPHAKPPVQPAMAKAAMEQPRVASPAPSPAQPQDSVIQAKARQHAEQVRLNAEANRTVVREADIQSAPQTTAPQPRVSAERRQAPEPQPAMQPEAARPQRAHPQTAQAPKPQPQPQPQAKPASDAYPALRVHPALAAQRAAEAEQQAEAERAAEAERRARARLQAAVQSNPLNQSTAAHAPQPQAPLASAPPTEQAAPQPNALLRKVRTDQRVEPRLETVATQAQPTTQERPTPVFHSSRNRHAANTGHLLSA